jgi:hypothetical protein
MTAEADVGSTEVELLVFQLSDEAVTAILGHRGHKRTGGGTTDPQPHGGRPSWGAARPFPHSGHSWNLRNGGAARNGGGRAVGDMAARRFLGANP